MRRHSKSKPDIHSRRIMFDRRVEKFFDFRKCHDLVELAFDFRLAHSENRAVEKNIFAPGQFGVKTRPDFE